MKNIFIYFFIILTISFLIYKLSYNQKKESFFISNIDTQKNYVIPKIIFSTYFDKSKIPIKVYTNIKKYAPNHKFLIFDDKEIILFFKNNYPPKVLKTFNSLHRGPHKADLFRYCYLYKFGGIYIDIKTVLIKNIENIFNKKNVDLYTVISRNNYTIHQGVIASIPNNPLFIDLINYIINIDKPVIQYFAFTIDFYNKLKKIYKMRKLKTGYLKSSTNNSYLFYEKCSQNPNDCEDGLDRYNVCCYIYDEGKKIIKTRYSDYPWK